MPMFSMFKRCFSAWRYDDGGEPIPHFWMGGDEERVLVEFASGRLRAIVGHDGCGKFAVLVFVSLFRAAQLKLVTYAKIVTLFPFPRCCVQLFDQRGMEAAIRSAEAAVEIHTERR
jgi:hypothetical protein